MVVTRNPEAALTGRAVAPPSLRDFEHWTAEPAVVATSPAGQITTSGSAERLLRAVGAVTAATDWPSALAAVTSATVGLAGAIRSTLLLWDQAANQLEVAAESRSEGGGAIPAGSRIALERWPLFRAALLERRAHALGIGEPALTEVERRLLENMAATSALVVPLVTHDRALGLLLLFGCPSRPFTGADRSLGQAIGDVLGMAVSAARAIERGRQAQARQEALFRLSQAATATHDQQAVLREIVQAAVQMTGCDWSSVEIWRAEGGELETGAWHAAQSGVGGVPLRSQVRSQRRLRSALEQRLVVHFHAQMADLTTAETEFLRDRRLAAVNAFPMVVAGRALGLLTFGFERPAQLDREAIETARELAARAALALQHGCDAEHARRRSAEQAALLRVSRAVISGGTLREVLDLITATAVEIELEAIAASRVWLWHQNRNEVELVSQAVSAGQTCALLRGASFAVAGLPPMQRVLLDGELVSPGADESAADGDLGAPAAAHTVLIPIVVGADVAACFELEAEPGRRLPADVIQFGQELAEQAAHAIERARLYKRLRVRAETDGLTGLLNHRAAFETLDYEIRRAREDGTTIGVIVVDLDDFKLFNDTHGHLVGDRVLVQVARVLQETVGGEGRVARYGGDEFLVILPGTTLAGAQNLAQTIVEKTNDTTVDVDEMQLPVRCSVGVATFPRDARNRPELIAYADSSMYKAKELGGGQVGSINRGTRSLEVSTLGALSGLVRAVDRKDRYTKDHSDLVAEYAVRFGRALGLPPDQIEALELAGQLHDVGKIAVPDSILRKPGHLTPDEEAMIRQHVVFSELMIKGVPHLEDVLAAVAHHHERWDGGGYPYGKSGAEIPLLGRILAFADALAAISYDRPYRKGRTLQQAVEEIRAGAGTQFDPDLVEPFIAAVTSNTGLLSDAARRAVIEQHAALDEGSAGRHIPVEEDAFEDMLLAGD